jgi:hypothetical protein
MPSVDRNILRLAVYEMTHLDTPAAVVIDEALELARRYSNEESVQFVNGVLDAVHRDLVREKGVGVGCSSAEERVPENPRRPGGPPHRNDQSLNGWF